MAASDAARLNGPEDENRPLAELLAGRPAEFREVALRLIAERGFSDRRACALALVDPKRCAAPPSWTVRRLGSGCANSRASGASASGASACCPDQKEKP